MMRKLATDGQCGRSSTHHLGSDRRPPAPSTMVEVEGSVPVAAPSAVEQAAKSATPRIRDVLLGAGFR